MNNDDIMYLLWEMEEDTLREVMEEWYIHKRDTSARQSWKLIPANLLKREWKYNQRTGLVHDKIIDKMQDIVINNYLKLCVNTILFGHTSSSPYHYAESYIDENMSEEEFDLLMEDFEWFACDKNSAWRISDYGLDKIGRCCRSLLGEIDYNKKLAYIDMILNVAHQRSDLASWFVEGGQYTLSELSA